MSSPRETEALVEGTLVFVARASGASKFREDLDEARVLDESSERRFCFNRFLRDRSPSEGVDMSMVGGGTPRSAIVDQSSASTMASHTGT